LEGEIEKSNQFNKRQKKKTIKRMKTELNKINHKLGLRDVIENNSKVYKRVKKKNRNQENKNQN
jgi:transcription initiation factor TFIIIB Brf1 subunit/transcription initiation factor TFIIB